MFLKCKIWRDEDEKDSKSANDGNNNILYDGFLWKLQDGKGSGGRNS